MKAFISQIIRELGNSPDDIAANLTNWQIKGCKGECGCPIGSHITIQLALNGFQKVKIYVHSLAVSVFDMDDNFLTCVDLTHPAESFVWKFDRGQYRDLLLQ